MEGFLKQSVQVTVSVLLIDSSDHITGKTGLTLTIYATKAGGTPAAITPTVTELDSTNVKGLYSLVLTTTHTNTLGELQLHITATGADPADFKWQIVACDLADSVRLGLTALPNAAAEAAGGLYTRGTGAGQIRQDANGRIDINAKGWLDGTIAAVNTTGIPKVDLAGWLGSTPNALVQGLVDSCRNLRSGTAQAGAAASITLDTGANSTTNNFYVLQSIRIVAGTGAGQPAMLIQQYTASTRVAAVSYNWVVQPANDSVFLIEPMCPVDVGEWRESIPSALLNGRVSSEDVVASGTAQAGASGSITLASTSSSTTNALKGSGVFITGGTGSGQSWRLITAYDGGTKIASVTPAFVTPPDNTSVYIIGKQVPVDVATWAQSAVNALISGRVDATPGDLQSAAVDAIWAKTLSDLSSVPGATASVLAGINWLFELARNKLTQTASTQTLFKDDSSTTLGTAAVSDDGTTFTRTKTS